MDNEATLAGLPRRPQPISKGGSGFCVVSGTVRMAEPCKRKEVGREEGKRRVRGEVGRSDCKRKGGKSKGVLLDISAAPRLAYVETGLSVSGALTSSSEGSEGGKAARKSENNKEGAKSWGGQEGGRSRGGVGSVQEEESYEAQRDRQVAKVRKRFQLLLQQKSDM